MHWRIADEYPRAQPNLSCNKSVYVLGKQLRFLVYLAIFFWVQYQCSFFTCFRVCSKNTETSTQLTGEFRISSLQCARVDYAVKKRFLNTFPAKASASNDKFLLFHIGFTANSK